MPRKKRKYEEYMTTGFTAEGKRLRKFIASDSKAEFDRLKREAIIEAGKVRSPSNITLGEYAENWLEVYKSNKSIQTKLQYAKAIDKLSSISHMCLKDVSTSDLQRIINENVQHPRTCQIIKLTLKQIYKQAIQDGMIYPLNIADNLNLPKYVCAERRIITEDELETILNGNLKPQDRLYVEVLRNTGMRPSEALALQWSDINFDALEITVRRAFEYNGSTPVVKTTKTGTVRNVPIPQYLADMLRNSPRNSLFVFTYENGRPCSKDVYKAMSRRILKGLKGVNMYSFRHTYATNLYYNAVKPGIISTKKAAQIMGHSEDMFIKRYTHIDDSQEQMEQLREILFSPKRETEGRQGDQKETRRIG